MYSSPDYPTLMYPALSENKASDLELLLRDVRHDLQLKLIKSGVRRMMVDHPAPLPNSEIKERIRKICDTESRIYHFWRHNNVHILQTSQAVS